MNDLLKRWERYLGLLALALLGLGCLLVMRPFVSAILWAVVLCFSSWPLYHRLLKLLGNRQTLAAFCMSLIMILIVLMPFVIVGFTLADNVKEFSTVTRKWLDSGLATPPEWLGKIPVVGDTATAYWKDLTQDSSKLISEAKKLIEPVSSGLLHIGLLLGRGVLDLALSIFVAFFLFRDGHKAAERMMTGVVRILGERGKHLIEVAGKTVRGVVYGILGTALVQGVMAGVGFWIAGVPAAALLALLTFFFSVIPAGPPLIWVPATLWLFNQGDTGWGIFMLIWGLGISSIDNVVKPWLISQGSNMPFILIFFGVLGGALAFGFIGVFLGPTLLAVGFRFLKDWQQLQTPTAEPPAAESP